jgi:hypothetical protein
VYMYVECRVSDGHREAGLDACTKMEEEITSKIRDALCLEWKRSILFHSFIYAVILAVEEFLITVHVRVYCIYNCNNN